MANLESVANLKRVLEEGWSPRGDPRGHRHARTNGNCRASTQAAETEGTLEEPERAGEVVRVSPREWGRAT